MKRCLIITLSLPILPFMIVFTVMSAAAAIILSPLFLILNAIVLKGKESVFLRTVLSFALIGPAIYMDLIGVEPPKWIGLL